MKKKILTLIIAICLMIPIGIGLVACGNEHVHDFSVYWDSDDTYHWHHCKSDDCNELNDKAEHLWGDAVVSVAPTCQEEGVKTYTCLICGKTKTESISTIDHIYTKKIDEVPATCETDGVSEHYECIMCDKNEHEEENYKINKLGHTWGATEYIWNSDYTECVAKRTCTTDTNHIEEIEGVITSEIIQEKDCYNNEITAYTANFENSEFAETQIKNVTTSITEGHNYEFVDEIQPTCTTYGFEAHYYCNKCGEYFDINKNKINESELHIPKGSHDFNSTTYTWNSDYTQCTATRICKNDVSHIETETVTTIKSVTKNAFCDGIMEITFTATFSNPVFGTKTATIGQVGVHDWITTYSWNTDHTQCTATRICSKDGSHIEEGKVNSETVYSTSVLKAPSTCTTNEIRTYTATFTNSYFEEQIEDFEVANTAHHTFVNHICSICGTADNVTVAKIGSGTSAIGYTTLEAAIANVNDIDEDVIILVKDITITSYITITSQVAIDFNDYTITANNGGFIINGTDAHLSITNGSLQTNNSWLIKVYSGTISVASYMNLTSTYAGTNGYIIGYKSGAIVELPDYEDEKDIVKPAEVLETKEITE